MALVQEESNGLTTRVFIFFKDDRQWHSKNAYTLISSKNNLQTYDFASQSMFNLFRLGSLYYIRICSS